MSIFEKGAIDEVYIFEEGATANNNYFRASTASSDARVDAGK